MYSYTATIGRNYQPRLANTASAPRPMTLTAWEQFIEDVEADMLRCLQAAQVEPVTVEIHRGKGTRDGIEEESAKITVLRQDYADADYLDVLRLYLSENARQYSQDAIALTIGISELC